MANIIVGLLYSVFVIIVLAFATGFEKWMIFYFYLGIVEIALQLLVVWIAWKWSKQ